jgi:Ca2+-binding EF-hand superfamily protein
VALKPARYAALDDKQGSALSKAFHLFDQDNSGDLSEEEFKQMTRSAVDYIPLPSEDELRRIMHQFAQGGKEALDYAQTAAFLQSGLLRPEQSGRYYVTVSLAEAETIRRIMHMRLEKEIIDGANVAIALRCAAADNIVMDASHGYESGPLYQTEAAYHSLRFLNCDMYYKEPHIAILLRALQQSTCRERQIFFERVIGCRRRMSRKWEETPLAKLFTLPDEYHLLKQRAQSVRIREAVKSKGLLLFDAFRMFDTNRNGLITPAELWGAFDWLQIDATAEDILDFIRTADKNQDGYLELFPHNTAVLVNDADCVCVTGASTTGSLWILCAIPTPSWRTWTRRARATRWAARAAARPSSSWAPSSPRATTSSRSCVSASRSSRSASRRRKWSASANSSRRSAVSSWKRRRPSTALKRADPTPR